MLSRHARWAGSEHNDLSSRACPISYDSTGIGCIFFFWLPADQTFQPLMARRFSAGPDEEEAMSESEEMPGQ